MTRLPLFRPEVLASRKEHWLGAVRLTSSRLAWPATILGLLMMVTIMLLFAFGSYVRKERVVGRLVPAGGLLSVSAPIAGTVTELLVHESQDTMSGQPLLELSNDMGNAAVPEGVGIAVGNELQHRKDVLERDLADTLRSQLQEASVLNKRISTLSRQAAATRHRWQLRQSQAKKALDMLERIRPLERQKIVSGIQMQQYETAVLDAEVQADLAKRDDLDVRQKRTDAQAELDALPLATNQRSSEIRRLLSEVTEATALNEVANRLRLRAPANGGTVASLAVDVGQMVSQGQRLLSIIPANSPLRAELWAPSRAVGSLSVGTRVAMRYHAFPYQKYGQQYGQIIQISRSALTDDEILVRTGLKVGESAYRVVVKLDRPREPAQKLPLRATMNLDADLLLERKRLYEFVIQPLRALNPPQDDPPGALRDAP